MNTHPIADDKNTFISTWRTWYIYDTEKQSPNTDIALDFFGTYNFVVDWGDGTVVKYSGNGSLSLSHTYASLGTYTIRMSKKIPNFYNLTDGDSPKLLKIKQWGGNKWTWLYSQFGFKDCWWLDIDADDVPDISSSILTSLRSTFENCYVLTKGLSGWDVKNITDMSRLFWSCVAFNDDISTWNVVDLRYTYGMFANAVAFNQDISGWNTQALENTQVMFWNALAFNQDLGDWDVEKLSHASDMFTYATLSTTNYDSLLNGWAAQNVESGVVFGAGSSKYSAASASARNYLTTTKGWTITDGGLA